jgi:Cdc6-like AAA superfamily ATPase
VITQCVLSGSPSFFFVCGHGGTGKTFLWNAIIVRLRSEKKIVLVVASSGVASLLLPRGRTAHSRFKIPFDITDASTCSVKRGTMLAELIQVSSLIIWDEAPMTHRRCLKL